AAQWVVERLPLGANVTSMSDDLTAERERLDRGINLIQLYGVYTEVDCIFDTRNVTALWEKVPAAERKTFPFDPALFDWSHYFQDVHFPTVVRMSRAETVARKGKQPSGSTAPKAESSSVRAAIERRSGRADVLAVFDVDGTLVETNVVEYFLYMRLRAQPLEDWPAFMADMLRPRGDAAAGARGARRGDFAAHLPRGHAAHPGAQAGGASRSAADRRVGRRGRAAGGAARCRGGLRAPPRQGRPADGRPAVAAPGGRGAWGAAA
ncbi:MAG: hypothetical protein E6I82_09140, partial [Chloroflexi bacterium]